MKSKPPSEAARRATARELDRQLAASFKRLDLILKRLNRLAKLYDGV